MMKSYYDTVIAAQAKKHRGGHHAPDDATRRDRGAEYRKRKARARRGANWTAPFVGVDGEGAGIDRDTGRQQYMLLCAGEAELYTGKQLTTAECLDFLLSLDTGVIHVGYFFNYDITQILCDLPFERRERLINPKRPLNSYVEWRDYGIVFLAGHFLRVCRLENNKPVPGSSRTINDVSGFFNCSFLQALDDHGVKVSPSERREIAIGKARRGGEFLSSADIAYCHLECDLLARLMEQFRRLCIDAGIVPNEWQGSGRLAAAMHKALGTPRHVEKLREPRINATARSAYIGGRFEAMLYGRVPGPIYAYDCRSAYAANLPKLPCPIHTRWIEFGREGPPPVRYWAAHTTFHHIEDRPLYHLPIRQRGGRLYWPRQGQGIFWSPELVAAGGADAIALQLHGGIAGHEECDCRPYAGINDFYRLRQSLGSDGAGWPIKVAMAGLYGKLSQRVGNAPYCDMIAAGLVTALMRADLINAYKDDPEAVAMLATDGLFTTRRLPALDAQLGTGLGQWSIGELPHGMFIVQPGFYWALRSKRPLLKTKGIPSQFIWNDNSDLRRRFEREWRKFMKARSWQPPRLDIPVNLFVGLRLGQQDNAPAAAGSWARINREISFAWRWKRRVAPLLVDWEWHKDHIRTLPWDGDILMSQNPGDPDLIGADRLLYEAMPDYVEVETIDRN